MTPRFVELTRLLPPPAHPRHTSGDWSVVEKGLGKILPADFKEFTATYGTVKICNCLVIHTPFPWKDGYPAFLTSLSDAYDLMSGSDCDPTERAAVRCGRDNIPFPDFPAPGGLLPVGTTDSGHVISWITEGEDPDKWGIFFWAFPGIDTYVFRELTLAGFLFDLVRLTSPLFPSAMAREFFEEEEYRGVLVVEPR